MGTPLSQCAALACARRAEPGWVEANVSRSRCATRRSGSLSIRRASFTRAAQLRLRALTFGLVFDRFADLAGSALGFSDFASGFASALPSVLASVLVSTLVSAFVSALVSSLSAPARLRLFSLSDLKSVSYQPDPLSRNTGADISFFK